MSLLRRLALFLRVQEAGIRATEERLPDDPLLSRRSHE